MVERSFLAGALYVYEHIYPLLSPAQRLTSEARTVDGLVRGNVTISGRCINPGTAEERLDAVLQLLHDRLALETDMCQGGTADAAVGVVRAEAYGAIVTLLLGADALPDLPRAPED